MRILQLAPIWETVPPPAYGGTETVVSVLTEELQRRGHEVTLAATGDSTTSAHLQSVFPRALRSAGLLDNHLPYSLVHTAAALRDADQFDIIHNHNGPPPEIAMAMSLMLDTPFLTTVHNPLAEASAFIRQHYRGWYNAISQQQCRTMPLMPNATLAGVVHNAIDVDSFPYQSDKQDYFLFLGRMSADKAPHLAIEAAQRIGAPLLLAGKLALESECHYFETHVRPQLKSNRVEYLGEANAAEKRALLAGARALLMPLCWDEPFGLVMIEAMACGTPVIAFERGAAPEIVDNGRTGFLVEDVDGMVAAADLLNRIDPSECRQTVEERFSPAALADAYLEIYSRMLSKPAQRPAELAGEPI